MGEKPLSPLARAISAAVRVVVGLGILGVGIAIAGALVTTRPVPPRVARPDPNLQVRTMRVVRDSVPRTWEGYGTARAMVAAQIPAQVSGTVVERPAAIEAGMPVRPPQTAGGMPDDPSLRAPALLDHLVRSAGDRVVVRIDPSDYASRLDSALDQVEATRAQLDSLDIQETRLNQLVALAREESQIQQRELDRAIEAEAQGGGNTTEVERRRATVLAARRSETQLLEQLEQVAPSRAQLTARLRDQTAAADLARQNLARTVITSPIAGQLQDVMVKPGEWLQAGMVVARVVDLSRIEVPLRVPVEASGAIAIGDAAMLRVDTRSPARWQGRVVRLAPEVDAQTRTITAFVEVDQAPGSGDLLRPGQFVVGSITTSATVPVLLVPRRVVVDDRVFVIATLRGEGGGGEAGDDGVPREVARSVEVAPLFNLVGSRPDLDPVETQWSALRPGQTLQPGDRLIISNLDDLHDGLLVQGREDAASQASAPTTDAAAPAAADRPVGGSTQPGRSP